MNRGVRALLVLLVALVMAARRQLCRVPGDSAASLFAKSRSPSRPVVVAAKALPVGALIGPTDVRHGGMARRRARSPAPSRRLRMSSGAACWPQWSRTSRSRRRNWRPREAGAGLAPTIPVGMRAISVKVNEVIGVAGFVVPARAWTCSRRSTSRDETMTRTVVSNLQVLTAGTRYDQEEAKDGKPIPTTVVTLLATPEDAERVALAAAEGKILLALRNPLDIAPTTTAGVHLASLIGPPAPPPVARRVKGRRMVVAAPPPPPPPPPPPYMVETIRGAKRTTEEVKK